jgi:vesicle coat complex subunit
MLKRTIYGLVQSVREFYARLIEVLEDDCFVEIESDPCLLSEWDEINLILIGIYVNDCLVIGKETKILRLIMDLKNGGFNLEVTRNLSDYLSCWVLENQSNNEVLTLQLHLINNLRENVDNEVNQMGVFKLLVFQGLRLFAPTVTPK